MMGTTKNELELSQFRSELDDALNAIDVDHDRNIFKSGHEIAWRYNDAQFDGVHVRWCTMISPVFWQDLDLERLLRFAKGTKHAVSIVLERRTQFEVETFCARLEEIERGLTEGAPIGSEENPIPMGEPSTRAALRFTKETK